MERIHVSVRARPLSSEDAKTSPWRISGNSIFIPNQPSKFEFGTVFAYGQTSSGKTHTMRGSALEPGVIPLAVYDLFNIIHEEMDREFLLRMSYMEIYNEEINDLLAPEHRKLQIHESLDRGIFVAGLREEIVASPDQVLELMEFGESHRHIGETNMNVYSSRSHTIFRMIIESREKTDDTQADLSCDAVRVSVLCWGFKNGEEAEILWPCAVGYNLVYMIWEECDMQPVQFTYQRRKNIARAEKEKNMGMRSHAACGKLENQLE
ncbi:P-loop containing nucleoside triphosphate hydrolase superfamily protein [Forsythia ovata]|uniref:P-loop containing nucleoside triphosphate hydrolase superfamily protein n=1 Tax=Forsythia ovata TaxID=205694 RepID=A0ABD1SMH1_9LAMI